jgi:acetyl esterase/lipase
MLSSIFLFLIGVIASSCASFKSDKTFKIIENLPYTESELEERLQGDLYLSSTKKSPIVFVVHGGGWSSRTKSDMKTLSESLASHGFNVFNINYRLSPEHKHPAAILDLQTAVNFIKNNYPDIDSTRIGLWGYSSGAHTSLMYGMKYNRDVKAIVSGGAPYDLTWYKFSPYIKDYMGEHRKGFIKEYNEASPVQYISKGGPSFFLYHGKSDTLLEHSQMTNFEARLLTAGADVESLTVPWWGHATLLIFSKEPIVKGIKFLKRKLK